MRPGSSITPPVRVGYILKMFPRLSETFILNEVLELEAQGLALEIFSLKRPADAVTHAQTRQVRSPIHYLPQRITQAPWRIARGQLHVWARHRKAWRHNLRNVQRRAQAGGDRAGLLAFCQACCIIREMGGIRHLHAHYANLPAKIALLVQRLAGTSYSVTTHAKDIFQNDPFGSPKLHERLCRASFVVANSRFSADHIRSGLDGAGQIQAIYNGLDLKTFPRRTREPSEPVILSVGRLVEKKGFADLVRACQLLRQRGMKFTCELVGTGPLSDGLKEQIRKSGIGDGVVKLLGPLPQQVLREHYERAMAFALPCVEAADGDRDILPNVVKEAMAVGVPVVTSRLDGIEELIEHERSGLLIPAGDFGALANALERLLRDAALRARLSAAGRATVEERFDRRVNFSQLKELLSQAGRAPAIQTTPVVEQGLSYHEANCIR
jgi:glycosyltransferase involved in cell wall biosynthesis